MVAMFLPALSQNKIVRKPTIKNNTSKSTTSLGKANIIKVKTASQFLDALGSNRTIIVDVESELYMTDEMINRLNAGRVKEFKMVSDKEKSPGVYASWGFGPSVLMYKLHDLTIKGKSIKTKITIESSHESVFDLYNCNNVKIENLTLGHSEGTCTGSVVCLKYCNNINFANVGLFGCGAEGLRINDSNNISCVNSSIYQCKDYIFDVGPNVNNVILSNCSIYDIGCSDYDGGFSIDNNVKNLKIEKCIIKGIKGKLFYTIRSPFTLEDCTIYHLKEKMGEIDNVKFINCKFIEP